MFDDLKNKIEKARQEKVDKELLKAIHDYIENKLNGNNNDAVSKRIVKAIANGANVNAIENDVDDESILMYLCEHDAFEIIYLLAESGKLELDQTDRLGRTASMYAVFSKAPNSLRVLKQLGADFGKIDHCNKSVYDYCKKSMNEIRKILEKQEENQQV